MELHGLTQNTEGEEKAFWRNILKQ